MEDERLSKDIWLRIPANFSQGGNQDCSILKAPEDETIPSSHIRCQALEDLLQVHNQGSCLPSSE